MATQKNIIFIKNIIKKYGLHPATKRALSLFTISCVAVAYHKLLRINFGISYRAIGAIGTARGGKDVFSTLFNEKYIAEETGKIIKRIKTQKNYYRQKIFLPANKIFKEIKKDLEIIEKNVNNKPEYCLKIITEICPKNYLMLGIYNCFWRYFMENSEKELPVGMFKKIAKDRDKISHIYPKLEEAINLVTRTIGEKVGLDSDLLRCLTLKEMQNFLLKRQLPKNKIKELKKRKSGYLYFFIEKGNKELIYTDRNIIRFVQNIFNAKHKEIKNIKGHTAYGGTVRGKVYVHDFHKHKKIKGSFILVAVMTRPDEIDLIKRSSAIITDEGSILSHAAIIARELKKPCVIGTRIATQVLKDGDLVEVDANKGIVKILNLK